MSRPDVQIERGWREERDGYWVFVVGVEFLATVERMQDRMWLATIVVPGGEKRWFHSRRAAVAWASEQLGLRPSERVTS